MTTKHKPHKMIKAWVNNTELTVLGLYRDGWAKITDQPAWNEGFTYFICLPQYAEDILDCLNNDGKGLNISNNGNYHLKGWRVHLSPDSWSKKDWYMKGDWSTSVNKEEDNNTEDKKYTWATGKAVEAY